MVNAHTDIHKLLSEIAPCYYDDFTTHTAVPCITYKGAGNNETNISMNPTLHYSQLTYYIKVWANCMHEAISLLQQVDETLRDEGLRRTNYIEENFSNGDVCLVCTYRCSGLERDN